MKVKIRDKLSSIERLCIAYYQRLVNIKFAIKNRRFWRAYLSPCKKDSRAVVLAEVSNNVFLAMGTAILANVIAKTKNATVLYLAYNQSGHIGFKWLRDSFSKSYYESVREIVRQRTGEITAEVQSRYETLKKPADILELKYKGLLIGDLVYDISMRMGNWQATVWCVECASETRKQDKEQTNHQHHYSNL